MNYVSKDIYTLAYNESQEPGSKHSARCCRYKATIIHNHILSQPTLLETLHSSSTDRAPIRGSGSEPLAVRIRHRSSIHQGGSSCPRQWCKAHGGQHTWCKQQHREPNSLGYYFAGRVLADRNLTSLKTEGCGGKLVIV